MSHSIYYTSAPEGLRPGQRGLCTVATTDGIPRPLWDRLESVSGYRHEFSAGSGNRNPVAWAHWLLSVQGRETSVLSRVCDSGLDYTQRTNSFAHHVALESAERAAGGPAWMLSRPGVMASQWNGQVGLIARPSLPSGDVRPAPCTVWQRLTGDAGWGGVLAEAGLKHPRRAACILFRPDQDVLSLIAESIALLPANKRWDITFNTYFTGLPGNAVCAWRCCLAGTPAAADAVRHAGGGLVIDLTRPGGLGAPAAGTWVDAARSGRAPVESAAPAIKRPSAGRSASAAPAEVEPLEVLEESDERDDIGERGRGLRDDNGDEPVPARSLSEVIQRMEKRAATAQSSGATRSVDTSWVDQQARSRRWLALGVTFVALVFIAAGIWLRMSANRQTADRPLQPTTRESDSVPDSLPVIPGPPPIIRIQPPAAPVLPTAPTTVEAPPVEPPPVTPVPVPLPPPALIQLPTQVLSPVTTGAALKAPTQVVVILAGQFDNLPAVASFKIVFPGKGSSYAYRQKDLAGVLTAESSGGFRYNLHWRDDTNKAVIVDVASIALEPSQGVATLEIAWRMKALLNRPEVVSLVRVLLHNADLVVADAANRRPQTIRFRQPDGIDVVLSKPSTPLSLTPMPDVICRPDKDLPDGWTMAWTAGPATRSAASEADVGNLLFERSSTTGGDPAKFTVRIGPRWSTLFSDFAAQQAAARQSLANAESALAKVELEIMRLREAQKTVMEPIHARVAEAVAQLKLTDTELAARFTNRVSLRERIKSEKAKLEELRTFWETDIDKAVQKREPAETARNTAAETARIFEQWKQVEIIVELPGKLQVATMRLK